MKECDDNLEKCCLEKKIDLLILFKHQSFYICILIKAKAFKFVEWYVERSINFIVFLPN